MRGARQLLRTGHFAKRVQRASWQTVRDVAVGLGRDTSSALRPWGRRRLPHRSCRLLCSVARLLNHGGPPQTGPGGRARRASDALSARGRALDPWAVVGPPGRRPSPDLRSGSWRRPGSGAIERRRPEAGLRAALASCAETHLPELGSPISWRGFEVCTVRAGLGRRPGDPTVVVSRLVPAVVVLVRAMALVDVVQVAVDEVARPLARGHHGRRCNNAARTSRYPRRRPGFARSRLLLAGQPAGVARRLPPRVTVGETPP